MVIAKPRTARVERDDERVRAFELLKNALGTRASGEQIGERPVDPLEDRRPEQQLPTGWRLALEHFGDQVLCNRAFAPGELGGEALRIGMPLERQRSEPEARGPAFSPLDEPRESRFRQLHSGAVHQDPCFVAREAELVAADFGELAAQAQPMQAEPQILPSREHEAHGLRRL